jgi:hypothetical protein
MTIQTAAETIVRLCALELGLSLSDERFRRWYAAVSRRDGATYEWCNAPAHIQRELAGKLLGELGDCSPAIAQELEELKAIC